MSTLALSSAPDVAWDYGDVPYGLEPLTMPPSGHARAAGDRPPVTLPACDPERIRGDLRTLAGHAAAGHLTVPPAPSYDQLFWFRWITGHQVAFATWRLMGRLLSGLDAGEAADPGVLSRLESYTHGYCAMLLYSGSCPRSHYQSLIRPVMGLHHPGFSGTWAPDFTQVRGLLRGRPKPWLQHERAAGLRAAVDAHRDIHDAVAARLVPDGRSLLQETIAEAPVRPSERTAVLYDNFFLTLRAEVSDEQVAAQLLRRLRAVGLDLAVNGLYPLGRDDTDEETAAWGAVARCERRIGAILSTVATHAAELVGPAARAA